MRRVLKILGLIALAIAGLFTTSVGAIAALTASAMAIALVAPIEPSAPPHDPVAAATPDAETVSKAPVKSPRPTVE